MRGISFAVGLAALLGVAPVLGSDQLSPFDLTLGTAAGTLPGPPLFTRFACGSNGGPPMRKLNAWTDFVVCEPETDGLREVYFEFGDAALGAARALDDYVAAWSAGTQFDYFPIIASALFDDAGTLRGLRVVTDPRRDQRKDPFLRLRPRIEHYLMRLHLMEAFGLESSGCVSFPMRDDEAPVIGMFERETCDWSRDGETIHIESVFVRRKGEADVNPETGRLSEGQFESVTRAEFRALP